MAKQTVSVELDDETIRYLRVLGGVACGDSVEEVIGHLCYSAADGVRRPGAWERNWVIQCFSDEFVSKLRPDPSTSWHVLPPDDK